METCFKVKEHSKYKDTRTKDFCIFNTFKGSTKGRDTFKHMIVITKMLDNEKTDQMDDNENTSLVFTLGVIVFPF